MLKAWASMKSFRPKGASDEGPGPGPGDPPQPGRNGEVDFRVRSALSIRFTCGSVSS
jgi:hypothetical protein